MKRTTFALLLLALTAAACTNYSDRLEPYPEALPPIQLTSLKGQDVTLELRDQFGLAIIDGFLREDLERSLGKAGLNVTARAPLTLKVTSHYLDSQYRLGRWESCGRLTGQLTRNGQAIAQPFTSNYCTDTTPNPWENAETQRSGASQSETRARTYFGLLRTFLMDLEKNVETL